MAMNTKIMPMHVAPGEDDLQRRMEGGQGLITTDEEATSDQRADALHDHTELIDVEWGKSRFQTLLVKSKTRRKAVLYTMFEGRRD
jgi:hypothetical protein